MSCKENKNGYRDTEGTKHIWWLSVHLAAVTQYTLFVNKAGLAGELED